MLRSQSPTIQLRASLASFPAVEALDFVSMGIAAQSFYKKNENPYVIVITYH